jgi:hypothetical protein
MYLNKNNILNYEFLQTSDTISVTLEESVMKNKGIKRQYLAG